jgi:kynurenine formamidase
MNTRWTHRPEGSNWGDFGPDDQLGRLNLITPEKVKQGIAEVREGLVFNLSLPLDYPGGNKLNPRRHPPRLQPTLRNGKPYYVYEMRQDVPGSTDVACDDAVLLHLQYSTQWDSFAHIGSLFDADGDGVPEPVFYNGFRGREHVIQPSPDQPSAAGALKLGLEHMAAHGVQGRAVMIDLRHHFGVAPRKQVGYDDLMTVCESDDVRVEKGDMVCLHTGFAERVLSMQRNPDVEVLQQSCAVLDGTDKKLLQWITDSGLSVLIADNYAVEERRWELGPDDHGRGALLPIHELCLFKLGIHLGELWQLTPLAQWLRAHGRSRFLLTAPPLRLPGAVGSPVNPIATV